MRKAKKLLVTLLVLVFMLSTFSVGFAAEAEEELPDEVVRAMALGILKGDDQGNLNLDKPITRAEALALIVRISGLEGSADLMAGQTEFTDVNTDPSLQWATGYINLGVGQGIVNGYPDGTFKGNNQVTYAEMAKMILYAMNYGVTVEGAPWPAGVMGKADDLGLFDDVNALPNVPALRGDVVKMIDNSLTVNHLKQTGYGDFKQYEEDEDTNFLTKLDVNEIDGRVTAIDVKDNEITVDPDEDEEDISKATTYTVIDDSVDVEALLGVEVTVWVNDDDEAFFVDPDMDDVEVDVIDEDVAEDADEIALRIADDDFDVASNVKVYINGESKDLDDLKEGMYGYFVFDDDDEIIYINVKDWNEVNAGVVTEVDENIISYFLETESESELDLEDPDDGYIIVLDGEAIDVDDIEKNDVIYVAEYDDMYYIIVVRNAVEGKVERIKDDEVKIDGKTYDVTNLTTYSLDEDDEIALYDADKAADLTGEEATAILDIAGDLRHITSAAEATSDEIFGVLTKVDEYNEVVKIFANGESKSYDIDGDIYEGDKVDENKIIDWDELKAYTAYTDTDGNTTAGYAIVMFELNKDGEIEDLFVLGGYNKVTGFNPNSNNDYTVDEYTIAEDGFDDKHDVIEVASDEFYVKSTTKFIDEIDDMDDVKWEDIESKDVPDDPPVTAIIVSNDKGDAELVVFTANFSEIAEEEELGVVLDKFVEDGDWKATVMVHDGEETDYLLDNRGDVNIGEAIVFKVNSDNELTNVNQVVYQRGNEVVGEDVSDYKFVGGEVEKRDGNYITVEGKGTYRVDSLTLIYDVTGDDVLDDIEEARLSDVKVGKNVGLVVDGKVVKILYITKDVPSDGGNGSIDDEDLVDAVNEAATPAEMNKAIRNIAEIYEEELSTYNSLSYLQKNELAKTLLDLAIEFDEIEDVIDVVEDLAEDLAN